jgi:large subunit ribosomal protein L10
MPSSRKIFSVQNLAEKFKTATGVVLSDYTGLKVDQINELRAEIKKTGGEFEVVKNSLLNRAASDSHSSIPPLTGPTAALWVYQEDLTPLKIFQGFMQKNELPKIKLGLWQGEEISAERVIQLACLPTLPELQVKLVGLLQTPIQRLPTLLNANLQKLVWILKEVKTND